MLLRLAWRNIWRNYRRSLIVMAAISVGLGGTVLSEGFMTGMGQQMLDNAIGGHLGDIQIHRNGYQTDPVITSNIADPGPLLHMVDTTAGVSAAAPRVLNAGLASSPQASGGVLIAGVEPDLESRITFISRRVVSGRYLRSGDSLGVLIGRALAEKLQVGLGDKIVLMGQSVGPELGSGAFRVVGLFQTYSTQFDRSTVYIDIRTSQVMFNLGERISEVVLRVRSQAQLGDVMASLKARLDTEKFEVFSWHDLAPILVKEYDVFREFIFFFYLIIFIAVAFGVVNTMLMAVFERVHELGLLMSIGAKPVFVFRMILWESAFLGVFGVLVGNIITLPLLALLKEHGLNLSVFADSLSTLGVGSLIYPYLSAADVVRVAVGVVIIAVLASIYPAFKAARLQPVEALRFT